MKTETRGERKMKTRGCTYFYSSPTLLLPPFLFFPPLSLPFLHSWHEFSSLPLFFFSTILSLPFSSFSSHSNPSLHVPFYVFFPSHPFTSFPCFNLLSYSPSFPSLPYVSSLSLLSHSPSHKSLISRPLHRPSPSPPVPSAPPFSSCLSFAISSSPSLSLFLNKA